MDVYYAPPARIQGILSRRFGSARRRKSSPARDLRSLEKLIEYIAVADGEGLKRGATMSDEPVNRDAWRAAIQEQPIEPELPIIDAHHHIWPEAPSPHFEAYDVEALTFDVTRSGHNIVATVFVEAGTRYRSAGPAMYRPVGETEFVEGVAREVARHGTVGRGLCAGIVAHANMLLGDSVEEVLIAHREASPRLRGIRHIVAHDRDYPGLVASRPGIMRDSAFRAAFARLASHDLSFDVWLMHPQLAELAELAADFSDTRIILNHLGTPMGIGRYANGGAEGFEEWRRGLALVARQPNVMLKLGGLNMGLTGLAAPMDTSRPWTSEQMARAQSRHVRAAIDLFGPSRCMFESNFPVDRMAASATVLWNSFKLMAAEFSASEKAALFHDTAARGYRLALS
jgi:predicted TIM-barrel fold metal-dependent hydrolase